MSSIRLLIEAGFHLEKVADGGPYSIPGQPSEFLQGQDKRSDSRKQMKVTMSKIG